MFSVQTSFLDSRFQYPMSYGMFPHDTHPALSSQHFQRYFPTPFQEASFSYIPSLSYWNHHPTVWTRNLKIIFDFSCSLFFSLSTPTCNGAACAFSFYVSMAPILASPSIKSLSYFRPLSFLIQTVASVSSNILAVSNHCHHIIAKSLQQFFIVLQDKD